MEKTNERKQGAHFLFSSLSLESLFTPEDFTDEHKMIASTARKFVEKEVIPLKERIENQDFEIVQTLLKKAGDIGLLAHSIPQKYGGLGLDKVSKGIVGEMVGQSSGYGVAHSNHTCIATLPITYFGTEQQKEKYLPKMASGEYIGAYCLTEPNAGSDALAAETTAKLNDSGTHYLLNGTKIYITNASFSQTFIVYAKIDAKHFTAFIIEKDFRGLSFGPEEKKMGIKGSSTRTVFFENCEVPVENVLGEIGKGHVIALNVLNLGRFNLGSACMGGAKAGYKKTIHYIQERKQFGSPIGNFPASKEKMAKMAARIYATESLQYRTAHLLESALGNINDSHDQTLIGKSLSEYATECAVCKVYSSETLDYVADEALQLHGGAGFIKDYGIEQMYRDSRINRIFEGTNEINRLLIPTHLLRKGLKGEIQLHRYILEAKHQLEKSYSSDDGVFAKERNAIELIRRMFLICTGLAFEKYGEALIREQEILMKLADIAIELYASESTVYRTYKSIVQSGTDASTLKVDLTHTLLEEAVTNVEKWSRWLIHALADGDQKEQLISITSKMFSHYTFYNHTILRNRRIADEQYKIKQFHC
ncbi:acyl-CoA dehydrogenase family protein [Bacillus spongiae]|uniref:Acyl-CoA dehydrogenase family protein n=1 Tax=Bacillus spongiae TaxID=2683610 RepID=A0ABU8HCN7_9BACI